MNEKIQFLSHDDICTWSLVVLLTLSLSWASKLFRMSIISVLAIIWAFRSISTCNSSCLCLTTLWSCCCKISLSSVPSTVIEQKSTSRGSLPCCTLKTGQNHLQVLNSLKLKSYSHTITLPHIWFSRLIALVWHCLTPVQQQMSLNK